LAEGNKEEALRSYSSFLNQYPDHPLAPNALYGIIHIYESMGEFDLALRTASQFIERYPDSKLLANARLAMARALIMKGEYSRAETIIIETEPLAVSDSAKAELLLTEALLDERRGRIPAAISKLAEVYSTAPQSYKEAAERRTSQLITIMSDDELAAAEIGYANRFPEELFLAELGRRYMAAKNYDRAEKILSRLVKAYPSSPAAASAQQQLKAIRQRLNVDPKTIGCVLPLSGQHEAYGQSLLFGLLLGIGAYTQADQQPAFRLLVRDSEGKPEVARKRVEELANVERVGAIIGPLLSSTSKEAALQAQALSVPIITLTQSEDITAIGDYVFRNFITARMQMKSLAEYVIGKRNLTRFAVFHPNSDYGKIYTDYFTQEITSRGGRILAVEGYDTNVIDFQKPFEKLIQLDAKPKQTPDRELEVILSRSSVEKNTPPIVPFQALFIPDDYQKLLMIAPQVAYFDVEDLTLLGTNLWNTQALAQKGDRYVNGALFPSSFFLESSEPAVVAFRTKFKEVFDREPDLFSAIAYDTAKMLIEAILRSGAWSRSEIRESLVAVKDYTGVTGLTSGAASGDFDKKLYMLTISGGRITAAP